MFFRQNWRIDTITFYGWADGLVLQSYAAAVAEGTSAI